MGEEWRCELVSSVGLDWLDWEVDKEGEGCEGVDEKGGLGRLSDSFFLFFTSLSPSGSSISMDGSRFRCLGFSDSVCLLKVGTSLFTVSFLLPSRFSSFLGDFSGDDVRTSSEQALHLHFFGWGLSNPERLRLHHYQVSRPVHLKRLTS